MQVWRDVKTSTNCYYQQYIQLDRTLLGFCFLSSSFVTILYISYRRTERRIPHLHKYVQRCTSPCDKRHNYYLADEYNFNSLPHIAAHLQAAQKPTHIAKLAKEPQFCQRTADVLTKCLNLRLID